MDANGVAEAGAGESWAGLMADAVTKCGRESERRLFVHGISCSRCPKCHARLKGEVGTCSCGHTIKTPRTCRLCSNKNAPVMWCAECDEYFCAGCHDKPHVLMLGSSKPHHCFVIDGASGKHFVKASWANEFVTTVQAMYRKRVHDRAAIKGSSRGPVQNGTTPQKPVGTSANAQQRGKYSITPEQALKRQVPEPASTTDKPQKAPRPQIGDTIPQANGAAAAALKDGMSLYDRVRAMHDQRAKAPQKSSQDQASKMSVERLLAEDHQKEQEEKNHQKQQEMERTRRIQEQLRQQGRELAERAKQQQEQKEREQAERERVERLKEVQQKQKTERAQRLKENLRKEEEERVRQRRLELEKRQKEYERQQRLLKEQLRHEKLMQQQSEERHRQQQQARTQSKVVQECNRFVSQAQQVLQTQPGYATAPPVISTQMPSASPRFVRVPSPVPSAFPHGPDHVSPRVPTTQAQQHFQSSQGFPARHSQHPPPHSAPMTSGFVPAISAQDYTSFEATPASQDRTRDLVVRDPNNIQAQNQQMVPHQRSMGSARTPTASSEDDELRVMWVNDYDNINAMVMKLERDIAQQTEEGHAFVHRSNNISIPEQLQHQINTLRVQRDQAIEARFKAVIRVLIFSSAVRSFAQQNEHTNIWSDVPEVLKASHKKCAELAVDIREFEGEAQTFRKSIDEAVSSGDPTKMQNVAQLGSRIAELEGKIAAANAERDKQFTFMFQFSESVRRMVRAERNGSSSEGAVGFHTPS